MSTPSFNFGSTGSSGSSNLFGQSSAPKQSSLPSFGQPTASSTNAGSSPFQLNLGTPSNQPTTAAGGAGTPAPPTTTTSLFSGLNATSNAPAKPLFGNFGSNSGTSTPSFGASTGNAGNTNSLFGASLGGAGTPNQPSGNSVLGTGSTTTNFNAFSGGSTIFGQNKTGTDAAASTAAATPNKTETPQPSFGSLWGSKPSGPSVFGGTPATSAPAGSTTPATSKPAFSFASSTTPAGPPPAEANATSKTSSSGLFSGFTSTTPSGGPFGQKPAESSAKPPASSQVNNLFTGSTPAASSNLFSSGSTPATSSNLFSTSSTSMATPSVFSTAAPPASKPSLFSGLTSSTPAAGATSLPNTTSSTVAPSKPMFSFPSAAVASQAPESSSTTAATPSNLFGTNVSTSTAPASSISTASATATSNLFAPKAPSTTATASSSLFGPPTTSAPATTGSNLFSSATTSAATPASTSFGLKPAAASIGETKSSTAEASANAISSGATGPGASTAAPLGASTAGPAPQLSRLKNKTMDEIITRWASDLSKYQKEFQDQAAKVASWDRLLVENGEKIQKLYVRTFEAERASAEVERQLASVESQQDELAAWLDRYEHEVDEMYSKHVGLGEALQGPDQERERTYKLAERLTDRLDEMGKDLTNMIQEINSASATLSKTSKPDDPLSQIVRVLNGHLAQLQWIDQNAAALQVKVTAAQKAAQNIGANGGGDNDPVDEMFRSYLGRK